MRSNRIFAAAILAAASMSPYTVYAGTLRGSSSSMEQQHDIAVEEDLTFTERAAEVQALVDSGKLVAVKGNSDYALSAVSFPYARPEIVLFIERLSAQYHSEIGSRLIVTSLTRPEEKQPRNAHKLSVHPAGMAVDFRVPATAEARAWLEKALLGLENSGVLDVTREKNPPHYHVAVFPAEYKAYAMKRLPPATPAMAAPLATPIATSSIVKAAPVESSGHSVNPGFALALTLVLAGAAAAAPRILARR